MIRANVIEMLKLELTSFIDTTGNFPEYIHISKYKLNELAKLTKIDPSQLKHFTVLDIKLKIKTSDYYDDNTLYVSN